jgi:SAM-dependent methyltransferase
MPIVYPKAASFATVPIQAFRYYTMSIMIPFGFLGPVFKLFAGTIYPGETRRLVKEIVRSLESGDFVLDLGAGTGILSDFAREERSDLRYVALDPAIGMLKNAPQYISKVLGRAEGLPFKRGIFNAVLIGDAIHHVNDPEWAIIEIKRVLKRNGVFFVFDMDPEAFMGRAISLAERLFREPARFYPPEQLAALLTKDGFKVEIHRHDWRYSVTAKLTD